MQLSTSQRGTLAALFVLEIGNVTLINKAGAWRIYVITSGQLHMELGFVGEVTSELRDDRTESSRRKGVRFSRV